MLPLNKIKLTNKILYLVNLILALGIIIYFSLPKKELRLNERRRSDNKFNAITSSPLPPYSHYAELIGHRDLFVPLVKEEIEKINQPPKEPSAASPEPLLSPSPPPPPPLLLPPPSPKVPLEKRISHLSLIGVIFDEKGGTAIIQDKGRNREYFLKKGDKIQEMKIEDVLEDKVILTDGEEEIELRM